MLGSRDVRLAGHHKAINEAHDIKLEAARRANPNAPSSTEPLVSCARNRTVNSQRVWFTMGQYRVANLGGDAGAPYSAKVIVWVDCGWM